MTEEDGSRREVGGGRRAADRGRAGRRGRTEASPIHVSTEDKLLGRREGRYLHSSVKDKKMLSPVPICVSLKVIQ